MIDDLSLTELVMRAQAGDTQAFTELVMRAQAGDTQAFTELFLIHYSKICTYLARLVSHHDQWPDLAQETFLQVWKELPNLRHAQQFTSWLYRIATNEAMSFLRKEERWWWSSQPLPEPTEDTQGEYLSTPGPEESVAEEDWLKRALRKLEPQCRVCLLLYVVGGFSQREIAALLGIRENTVSGNVCRGRNHLRYHRQSERRDV